MPKMFTFKRKKLRATAVRRPLRMTASAADYGDIAEPSMKLSRALLIVLLLHVVAVAGIIAFNASSKRDAHHLCKLGVFTKCFPESRPQRLPPDVKNR